MRNSCGAQEELLLLKHLPPEAAAPLCLTVKPALDLRCWRSSSSASLASEVSPLVEPYELLHIYINLQLRMTLQASDEGDWGSQKHMP